MTGGNPVPDAEIMGVLLFLIEMGVRVRSSSLFATELMPDLAHAVDAEVVVLNHWGHPLAQPCQ